MATKRTQAIARPTGLAASAGLAAYADGGVVKTLDENGRQVFSQDLGKSALSVQAAPTQAIAQTQSPNGTPTTGGAPGSGGNPMMDIYRREAASRGLDPTTFDKPAVGSPLADSANAQPAPSASTSPTPGGLAGASMRSSSPSAPPLSSLASAAFTAPGASGPSVIPRPPLSQGLNGPLPAGISMTRDASGRTTYGDRPFGYAGGGKISGPGTAKSDSISALVRQTGEPIQVSTGERILSTEQDAFLAKVAKNAGYGSLDAMLEDGTKKPVGPTLKAGKRAAAAGMAPLPPERDPFAFRSRPLIDEAAQQQPQVVRPLAAAAASALAAQPLPPGVSPLAQLAASPPAANAVEGAPGITKAVDPAGRVSYSGSGALSAAADPGRSAMDIYRSEAAMRGLDPATFDRAGGGPGGGAIRNTSITDTVAGGGVGMPSGLSARQQAQFMNQREQTQAQLRGQDMVHDAAMAGHAAEGQRQARQLDYQTARLGLDTRQADQGDIRLGLEQRRVEQAAERGANRGNPTLTQLRGNAEIDAARERVAGLTPDDIRRKTAQFSATGRENPEFDPTLAKAVGLSNRRKVGDDQVFDQRQQGAQPQAPDSDMSNRFKGDKAMAGHRLGKQTPQGVEVFDGNGRLIGHYN